MSKTKRTTCWRCGRFRHSLPPGCDSWHKDPPTIPYRPVRGLADGGGPSIPGGEWAIFRAAERWDRRPRCTSTSTAKVSGPLSDVTRPVRFPSQGAAGSVSTACILTGNSNLTTRSTSSIPRETSLRVLAPQMFIWPHGLHVDREGNVWATDAAAKTLWQRRQRPE